MKISISYPPLDSGKGIALLTQNRQFQWFNEPTFIYPVVPASAATLLKAKGYDVIWDDAIAEGLTYGQWRSRITGENRPDLIVFETKTPVVKKHWEIINDLKTEFPDLRIVLMGDHVSAMPLETFGNSKTDYIVTGGDYDFLLLSLADFLTKNSPPEPGIYWKNGNGEVLNSGKFERKYSLDDLPMIDRDLTRWDLYAYNNGNYKKTPGAYTMAGRDCWYHQCTFVPGRRFSPILIRGTPRACLTK